MQIMDGEPQHDRVARLRAGNLDIDLELMRVTRDGEALALPRLSFDLLVALARAAPGFVSHAELRARVWPGLVIADKTITQRAKLLREALGDDPRQPRYVAGLRGRGYRLVVPVQYGEAESAKTGPASDSPPATIRRAQIWPINSGIRTTVALAVAVLATAALVFFFSKSNPTPAASANDSVPEQPIVAPTVAVLPFSDLSGADGDAFLALGIPESVLDRLAGIPGLTVIARHSSFKAAADGLNGPELGSQLGARFLIDGTVQRIDNRLRVSATLSDAATSTQLWTQRFDRSIDDIFAIQDEIALRVADALRARIARFDVPRSTPRPTEVTEAYLAYLEGRSLIARWTIADTEAAERAFERAIESDPGFAAAHAALYDARLMLAERRQGGAANAPYRPRSWGSSGQLDQVRDDNQALLDGALALDPNCGAAYFARATWADLDDREREADFRKALALDPGNARGITAFAEFLDSLERKEEAKALLDRAREIDPLSPRPLYWLAMRDWKNTAAQIEDDMRRVLELDPDYQPALQRYSKARWWGHAEIAEAIQLIERALADDPDNPWLLHTASAIYLDAGDIEAARELVGRAEQSEIAGLLLLRLYEGDRAAAAELAFSDSAFAHGPFENWGVYEAVRDATLQTGEFERGIEYLRVRANLDLSDPVVTAINFRSMPALAELLLVAGRHEEAERIIERAIRWIDDVHLARMGKTWALRVKANLLMLRSDTDSALDTLQLAFAAPDYQQWWYTLEQDPLWAPLHEDPRFVEIVRQVRSHVSAQALLLEDLRKASSIPRRDSRTAAQPQAGSAIPPEPVPISARAQPVDDPRGFIRDPQETVPDRTVRSTRVRHTTSPASAAARCFKL